MQVKSLLIEFNMNTPATIEEYERVRGAGSCLTDAVRYSLYRGPLSAWREEFVKRVEEVTRIPREGLSEEEYVRNVAVQLGSTEEFIRQFAQVGQEIANGIPWDAAPRRTGTSKGAKPSKKWLVLAERVVAAGKAQEAASKLTQELGFQVEPEVVSLAKAIKEREARREAELVAYLS